MLIYFLTHIHNYINNKDYDGKSHVRDIMQAAETSTSIWERLSRNSFDDDANK